MATKIVDATKLDNALGATADAIRSKTGNSSGIVFDMVQDHGFADAIAAIPTGDGRCPRVYPEADLSSSDYDIPLSSLVVSEISPYYVLRIFTHESVDISEPELFITVHILQSVAEITATIWSNIQKVLANNGYSYAGEYATSFSGDYISASTLVGLSITQDTDLYLGLTELYLLSIIQNYTNDENASFSYSSDHRTLTINFTPGAQASGVIVALDSHASKINYQHSGQTVFIQDGTCNLAASLPTVVTTGANRKSYNNDVPSGSFNYATNTNYYFSISAQSTPVTITLTAISN